MNQIDADHHRKSGEKNDALQRELQELENNKAMSSNQNEFEYQKR